MARQKRCSSCHKWLDRTEFTIRRAAFDGLQNACRKCNVEKARERFADNPEKVRQQNNESSRRGSKEKRERTTLIKKLNKCAICGEAEPAALTFYRPRRKKEGVGFMVSSSLSWKRIVAEIKKSTVVCANCGLKVRTGLLKLPRGKKCKIPEDMLTGV